jgi:phosphate:Na+ symporter
MLLFAVQPFLGRLGAPALAAGALVLFHAAFVALALAPLCVHAPFAVGLLERRFRDDEQDETRPRHVDATTLDLPDLALAGLADELERVAHHALGFASIVLSEERATSFRTRLSLGVVERLGSTLEEHATLLTRAELPDHVARVLCDVPRATQAYRELVEWTNLIQTAPLDHELDGRLRREVAALQHEVAGLLGHSEPRRLGCTLEEASAQLCRLETRVRELEQALFMGGIPAESAHSCSERLQAVGRIGTLAVEAGHGLAGVFALCPREPRKLAQQVEPAELPPAEAAPESALENVA